MAEQIRPRASVAMVGAVMDTDVARSVVGHRRARSTRWPGSCGAGCTSMSSRLGGAVSATRSQTVRGGSTVSRSVGSITVQRLKGVFCAPSSGFCEPSAAVTLSDNGADSSSLSCAATCSCSRSRARSTTARRPPSTCPSRTLTSCGARAPALGSSEVVRFRFRSRDAAARHVDAGTRWRGC